MIYKCHARVNSKVNPTMDTLTFDVVANSLQEAYGKAIKEAFEAFKIRIPTLEEKEVAIDIGALNRF